MDDLTIRPGVHISVGAKVPGLAIIDDLPQYTEHVLEDAI